ncbi:MAG: HAD family hydrolase [Dehalococcoidia bacterium]|nr:HAD family hydrolase [Dehalococcoidia bacterium]
MAMRPAVFLDKDGTLVPDLPYNVDVERVVLAAGAGRALRSLAAAGYALVVVSNQSGVARGLFPAAALGAVARRLETLVAAEGAWLDGCYWCPHLPGGAVARYAVACLCRKPQPGLILRAAAEIGLSLRDSWMIGDILDDVEAGRRAGCRTVLLDNGHETEWRRSPLREPHAVVPSLVQAARVVLGGAPRSAVAELCRA